jgi:hypothetical protein
MHPLAAQIRLDLGHHFAAAGERALGNKEIALARQWFGRMNMNPWKDPSRAGVADGGHLYIVARSNPALYEFLSQEFTGPTPMRVVLDRREGQPEIRSTGERRQRPVDADLSTWELALTSMLPPEASAERSDSSTSPETASQLVVDD